MKPRISGEEMRKSNHWALRGERGQRALKDQPGTWETRQDVAETKERS